MLSTGRILPAFQDCRWTISPLAEGWESFTIAHYKSSSDYDTFVGEDLTINNHAGYLNSALYSPLAHLRMAKRNLSYMFCKMTDRDGSFWHVQRVGPMTSSGGYDWWQMSGFDVGSFSAALRMHGGVLLLENYMGGVSADGKGIGHPPLHVHHIHAVPTKGVLRFQRDDWGYRGNVVIEHHGDSSWCDGPGIGDTCKTRIVMPGFGKLIKAQMDLDCEFNDVRPLGHAPLNWYTQFAIRWNPMNKQPFIPLSSVTLVGKIFLDPGSQASYEGTFVVDARNGLQCSAYFGKWPTNLIGDVVQIRTHNHLTILEKGFLFDGSLFELQLDDLPILRRAALRGEVIPITALGHSSFESLETMLMRTSRGQLLCAVEPTLIMVAHVFYDRMPKLTCYQPYRLTGDSSFTSITFLNVHTAGQSAPSFGRMHTHWTVEYVLESPCSCYTFLYSFPQRYTEFRSSTNCSCMNSQLTEFEEANITSVALCVILLFALNFYNFAKKGRGQRVIL